MDKTCIIYGSSTGTCQAIAEKIASSLKFKSQLFCAVVIGTSTK